MSASSKMTGVAQLQKIDARVGFFDASVGMVLQSQAQLIAQLFTEEVAHTKMAGKVVAGWELVAVGNEAPVGGIAHAHTSL